MQKFTFNDFAPCAEQAWNIFARDSNCTLLVDVDTASQQDAFRRVSVYNKEMLVFVDELITGTGIK